MILVAISMPSLINIRRQAELDNAAEEIINTLRLAQSKALSAVGASEWGVYFDNSTTPHQFVLFKGNNYATRIVSFDQIHKIPKTAEFSQINLSGGKETSFERISGFALQDGSVSLRQKNDHSKTSAVYVENSGRIGKGSPPSPSDAERIKDSRHVHFHYSRLINTGSEIITLKFDDTVAKDIPIADNMRDDQIYWSGEVAVSGQTQKITIHTHSLNMLGTNFCVHREGGENTKSLEINISEDGSGYLLKFSADGKTVDRTSIYTIDIQWQ